MMFLLTLLKFISKHFTNEERSSSVKKKIKIIRRFCNSLLHISESFLRSHHWNIWIFQSKTCCSSTRTRWIWIIKKCKKNFISDWINPDWSPCLINRYNFFYLRKWRWRLFMKLWTLTRPLMPHFISPSSSSSPRLPLYLSLSLCSTNTNNHTVSPLSTSTSACRHVLCLPSLPHSEGPWWSTCLSRTNKSAPGSAPSELLQLPENKHDENSSAQDGQRCSVPPVGGDIRWWRRAVWCSCRIRPQGHL